MSSSKPRNRSRSPVRRSNERLHYSGSIDKKERRNSKDKGSKPHDEKTPNSDAKLKVQVKSEKNDSRNESNNSFESKENKSSSNSTPKQSYVSTSSRTYVNPVTGKTERKFSNRCRLFVGNITDMSEDEFTKLFEKYGQYSEAYVNKEKAFGFIKMVGF
ncbi:paraspeckle component 1-like [Paramuricea clavata]|uniref:Paraspeckle component 1-like n=1 Tax=Paramuricea clavata TaxID=317549 RepID=A0A6S7KSD5_PARCT|nr:paraspeckle component 1-like [Paramuricea clavata]